MLFIIGIICLVAFWIFMSVVVGCVIVNKLDWEVYGLEPIIPFASIGWPITLLVLAGLYAGEYLCRKK